MFGTGCIPFAVWSRGPHTILSRSVRLYSNNYSRRITYNPFLGAQVMFTRWYWAPGHFVSKASPLTLLITRTPLSQALRHSPEHLQHP